MGGGEERLAEDARLVETQDLVVFALAPSAWPYSSAPDASVRSKRNVLFFFLDLDEESDFEDLDEGSEDEKRALQFARRRSVRPARKGTHSTQLSFGTSKEDSRRCAVDGMPAMESKQNERAVSKHSDHYHTMKVSKSSSSSCEMSK